MAPTHSAAVANNDQSDSDAMAGLAIVFGGLGAVVALGIGCSIWMNRTVTYLRIIRTPPGEAPEHIRQAWVGAKLPLRRWEKEPDRHLTVGAVSKRGPEMAMGYGVDGRAAVKALASHAPDAAAWWRKHAPHVIAPGYRLWFPCDVCECVAGGREACQSNAPKILASELGLGADGREGVWRREVPPWEN